MARVRWNIDTEVIDNFDRESQYQPYDGPIPPNGVYKFKVRILKYVAGTRDKYPQLRIGLELVPRKGRRDEQRYARYFIMTFPPIAEKTAFRYVPFLDAINVSGREFSQRTIADEEGNIRKIGKWRNNGETIILAEIKDGVDQNNNPRKEVGWMGKWTRENSRMMKDTDDEEYENATDDDNTDDDNTDDEAF